MEQESYYFKVGLFVLTILASTIFIISWFAGHDSKMIGNNTFAIYFNSSVDGLTLGSPVKMKGIKIGNVSEIAFSNSDNDSIRVLINISNNIKIRSDTIASLQMQGITGASVIALENKNPRGEALVKKEGEEYIVIE
ncbi:MAG: MlaD family protein, partial [Pseudomonadota bacterium]